MVKTGMIVSSTDPVLIRLDGTLNDVPVNEVADGVTLVDGKRVVCAIVERRIVVVATTHPVEGDE